MPQKVTKEEKMVELAISKAKEFLQHAGHLGTIELEDDTEDVKVKRPKKNPSEVALPKTSNIEGKEDKSNEVKKSLDSITKSMLDIFEKVIKTYGEKFAPMTESNPILDADMRTMEDIGYGAAMKDLTETTRKLEETKDPKEIHRLAQRAYRAVRDLLEMDMGSAAPSRGRLNPPRP